MNLSSLKMLCHNKCKITNISNKFGMASKLCSEIRIIIKTFLSEHTMYIDPVCGIEITNKEKSETFEYNDKTYYFCSYHCLNQFLSVLIKLSGKIDNCENDYYIRLMK